MQDTIQTDESKSVTWARQAVNWAKSAYPANPDKTRFEAWMDKLYAAANNPYKMTIMRNQVTLGMNNNYWPCLSRLAIMNSPHLGKYIHPRKVEDLDNHEGLAMLRQLHVELVGSEPKLKNWRNATTR